MPLAARERRGRSAGCSDLPPDPIWSTLLVDGLLKIGGVRSRDPFGGDSHTWKEVVELFVTAAIALQVLNVREGPQDE